MMQIESKTFKDAANGFIKVEYKTSKGQRMPYYHSHSEYEIQFVCQGNVSIENNNQRLNLSAPAIVIYRPFTLHRTFTASTEIYRRYIVSFSSSSMENISRWIPLFNQVFNGLTSYIEPTQSQCDLLIKAFSKLYDCYKNDSALRCELFLAVLIDELLKASEVSCVRNIQSEHSYINNVMHYINMHFSEKLNIVALTDMFFISRAKLSTDFKKYTGTTVGQYIIITRINNAMILLKKKSYTLSQISGICGFCDDSHFIHTFKKITGMSPKEYIETACV